jgi:hypothetical protein
MHQVQIHFPAAAAEIAGRVRRSLELGERLSTLAQARPLWAASGFVGFSALCVCAMVALGALSARDCRVAPIPLQLGAGTALAIAVPANTPCTLLVRAGSATLDEISIDTPPQHGTLVPRGRTGTVYRPDRGFKGDDVFVFAVNARSTTGQERAIIRVQATVK